MHPVLMLSSIASSPFAFDHLAQISLFGVWDKIWPYLLMLAGFSLIVFVHELGHFAVAKWAGVRVEKFAIGFGREILGFTRGETRYSFNILPIGGFVKMLGQEDFDDKSNELKFKDDPRSFENKPVGHRMAIVSAGVVMNIIFGILLFMIVFMIGMDAEAPRIAEVEADSPADRAGLLPGDIIREINGDRVYEFAEVRYEVLLAEPHEPIELVVQRDGQIQPPFHIIPEYREPEGPRDIRRPILGIAPGVTPEILAVGPDIDPKRPDHPRVGDMLVEVDGVKVTPDNASQILKALVYTDGEIYVERRESKSSDPSATQRVRVEIPPRLELYPTEAGDPRTATVLGLTPLAEFGLIYPGGRAYYAGLKEGDTVLMWNDQPHPSVADIALSVLDHAERDVAFTVQREGGKIFRGFIRPKLNQKGPASIHALWKPISADGLVDQGPKARFDYVRPGGIADRAGISVGDLVLRVNDTDHPTSSEVSQAVRRSAGKPVSLTVQKVDGRVHKTSVEPQAPGSIDANFNLVADNTLVVGEILPTLHGKPSPAAQAGIPPGAKIVAINETPVAQWRELIDTFRTHAGTTVDLTYVDGSGKRQTARFPVPHTIRTLLGIGPEGRILKIDGRENVTILEGGRPETVSVRYREGTRAILRELVGQKKVPVEYRANPIAEKQIAYIDVTEDMVDPWLSRVAFSSSILSGPELVLLKGENALDAIRIGIHKTYYFMVQIYTILERMIFTRSLGVDSVSGPLGIFDMGGQVARADLVKFLFFLAMISVNLAVINFLPLPIVDGGLMVFLLIEKIKGAPVSLRVKVATQMIGIFLIVGIFVFVTYQDALRLFAS